MEHYLTAARASCDRIGARSPCSLGNLVQGERCGKAQRAFIVVLKQTFPAVMQEKGDRWINSLSIGLLFRRPERRWSAASAPRASPASMGGHYGNSLENLIKPYVFAIPAGRRPSAQPGGTATGWNHSWKLGTTQKHNKTSKMTDSAVSVHMNYVCIYMVC